MQSVPDPRRRTNAISRLVEAIAREVWRLHGRDGTLNWVGVERHLGRLLEQSRGSARARRLVLVPAAAAGRTPTDRVERRGRVRWANRGRAAGGPPAPGPPGRRPGRALGGVADDRASGGR